MRSLPLMLGLSSWALTGAFIGQRRAAPERARTRRRHGNGAKFTFACGAREKARLALRAVRHG